MKKPQLKDVERAKSRVEALRKCVAKAIISIAAANDLFQYECEQFWSTDLPYEIKETVGQLGVHLASLDQWFDDDEDANQESDNED